MEIADRPAPGFVLVDAAALGSDAALPGWISRAVRSVSTVPPKRRAKHSR
jgi:hypothetical protein